MNIEQTRGNIVTYVSPYAAKTTLIHPEVLYKGFTNYVGIL